MRLAGFGGARRRPFAAKQHSARRARAFSMWVVANGGRRTRAHTGAACRGAQHDWTSLMCAAMSGHASTANLLIIHKAELEATEAVRAGWLAGRCDLPAQMGYTPLMFAAFMGNDTVVKVLLDNKANADAQEHVRHRPTRLGSGSSQRADWTVGAHAGVRVWPGPRGGAAVRTQGGARHSRRGASRCAVGTILLTSGGGVGRGTVDGAHCTGRGERPRRH
jgi:hypothetical protein